MPVTVLDRGVPTVVELTPGVDHEVVTLTAPSGWTGDVDQIDPVEWTYPDIPTPGTVHHPDSIFLTVVASAEAVPGEGLVILTLWSDLTETHGHKEDWAAPVSVSEAEPVPENTIAYRAMKQ